MSVIKSVIPGLSQFLEIYPTLAEGVTAIAVSSPSGSYTKAISVSTHDLRKALGIDELGCGCDEADDNLKAAIKRAEDAEAFGAAAVARAEEAEAEALEQAKLVRTWADRAEKAEALVARVQRLRDVSGDTVGVEELDAILDPKPAFTLPTEAGVRFEAREKFDGAPFVSFVTLIGHDTPAYMAEGDFDCVYPPGEVMEDFTDHRLLGADQ